MFNGGFLNNRLSVGHRNRASHVQRILEPGVSRKSALAQAVSLPSGFEAQQYFHSLIFRSDCM